MARTLQVIRPRPTPPGMSVSVPCGGMFTLWALRADLTKANLIGANLDRTSEHMTPKPIHRDDEIPQCSTGSPAATMMRYPLDWAHEGLPAPHLDSGPTSI